MDQLDARYSFETHYSTFFAQDGKDIFGLTFFVSLNKVTFSFSFKQLYICLQMAINGQAYHGFTTTENEVFEIQRVVGNTFHNQKQLNLEFKESN